MQSQLGEVIHQAYVNYIRQRSTDSLLLDIDLSKLIPELDYTASDIVSHQRDALISRKDLAQKTKDFRKLDDPAKLGEWKGLLKGGQEYPLCSGLC